MTTLRPSVCMQLVCQRFLACARCKLWWMTPEWGSRALHIPPETQFALFQTAAGGPYIIALPLIDNQTFRGTLRGPKRWWPCLLHSLISNLASRGGLGFMRVKAWPILEAGTPSSIHVLLSRHSRAAGTWLLC